MSNYIHTSKHPDTGKWEPAEWLDDYFGSHLYGVRFQDGKIFKAKDVEQKKIQTKKELIACSKLFKKILGKTSPDESKCPQCGTNCIYYFHPISEINYNLHTNEKEEIVKNKPEPQPEKCECKAMSCGDPYYECPNQEHIHKIYSCGKCQPEPKQEWSDAFDRKFHDYKNGIENSEHEYVSCDEIKSFIRDLLKTEKEKLINKIKEL